MKCNKSASIGAGPSQRYGALPPNQGMQLTIKSVTPFAFSQRSRLFCLQLIQNVDMTFFVKCGEGVDQDEFILFSR
jgi:hypothetical protein